MNGIHVPRSISSLILLNILTSDVMKIDDHFDFQNCGICALESSLSGSIQAYSVVKVKQSSYYGHSSYSHEF